MIRHILSGVVTVLTLALLVPAARGQTCQQLAGSENLQFVGFWTGDVEVVLGGETLYGTVSYALTSVTPHQGGRLLTGTESGTFDFGGENTFTVQDAFSFRPASGLYNAINRITAGAGRFKDAFGKFSVHGTVDFSATPSTFASRMRGAICDASD
jgi:hypothetical protein